MRSLLISLLLTALLSACATVAEPTGAYTLYLVRHAEKEAGGAKDPALTAAGKIRAHKLAVLLKNKGISDIWSSNYQRTRNTAAPLAAELGIEVEIYDASDLKALVSKLEKNRRSALVVGHSDTTPELASLLCNCQVTEMDDTEYDRLLIVHMQNNNVTVETLIQ